MNELSEELLDDEMNADIAVLEAVAAYIIEHPLPEDEEECDLMTELREAVERSLFIKEVLYDLETVT
jgi:hypothetical protein